MVKALPIFLYLALKFLWAKQIFRESKIIGMEPVFWSMTAFLLPFFIGVFLFYRTKKEIVKNKELEKIKKPIILTCLLLLIFFLSIINL